VTRLCVPTLKTWLRLFLLERALSPSSAKAYATAVNSFLKWSGQGTTVQQAADSLSGFVAWRIATGSPYTTFFYRRALLTILRQAEDRGLCVIPRKVRGVRLPALQPKGFSDAEIRMLLCFADPWQRAAILLVRCAAPRRGDVFRVRWSQVSPTGVLRFIMNKPGERHAVQLWPEVIAACEAIRCPGDERLISWPTTMSNWHKRWERLGRRAGVDVNGRGLQAIRRTTSSLVAKEKGDYAAAKLLGHSPASGVLVFQKFYRVGEIVDEIAPQPPPLEFP